MGNAKLARFRESRREPAIGQEEEKKVEESAGHIEAFHP